MGSSAVIYSAKTKLERGKKQFCFEASWRGESDMAR